MAEARLVTPHLVERWRNNLRKSAVQSQPERQRTHPITVNFHFGGSTTAVTAGQTGIAEIPCASTLLSCHIYAGTALFVPSAVTATVDLQLGQKNAWSGGVLTPIHNGTLATITALAEVEISLTDWIIQFKENDIVACRLATFSGTATWLLVTLKLQPLNVVGLGSADLVDFENGDTIVDGSGNQVIWRQ